MSRPLRIEYPGAWYHIMNRGRRSESIFSDRKDYQMFMELLLESSQMWNVHISAYCLMTNHYHILIQTPNGNLSRCMRHLNSIYTQRYNRRYKLDGQLFRGRYKSILVSNDSHLLQLIRYIHKNPVKANIVKDMGEYEWSSYRGYLSFAQKWDWLYKDYIFSLLPSKKQGRLKPFIEFMQQEDSKAVQKLFSRNNLPPVFGPESFITRIKEQYYFKKKNYEVPDSKKLAPKARTIMSEVCDYYVVSFDDLLWTRRGVFNEPRSVAVYLLRHLRGESLKGIGNHFNIKAYSTVSSIIRRISKLKKTEKGLAKRLREVKNRIKGQT